MGVVIEAADVLVARNPATGAEIGRVPVTPAEDVAGIVASARSAQVAWADTPWKRRRDGAGPLAADHQPRRRGLDVA